MADDKVRQKIGTLAIRIASGRLFLPDEVGARVENFYPTEEGTLRSIEGPLPFLPNYATGAAPISGTTADITVPRYGTMHGIFHALVGRNGERDLLLCQTGSQIWEFAGWDQGWNLLIADASAPGGPPSYADSFQNTTRAQFPTQFESTSTGVVIVPQEGRAYFYDGTLVAPLGYTEIPGAPMAYGPVSRFKQTSFDAQIENDPTLQGKKVGMGINDGGYCHDALPGRNSGNINSFRLCRIGTTINPVTWVSGYQEVDNDGNSSSNLIRGDAADGVVGGWLEAGEWRAAVQWIDQWGNLSPLSGLSEEVRFDYQPATYWDWTVRGSSTTPHTYKASFIARADDVRKQIAWGGLDNGPPRTIGKILYRTKDLINSGTTTLYRLSQDATESGIAFATLPDNVSTVYPDNIPDAWLLREAQEIVPVPQFKLCRVAFGRLWIANTAAAPGLMRPSLPGRWGTFPVNQEIFPDPSGDEVTGLWRASVGLLAFTRGSTYLVMPNEGNTSFASVTISAEIGTSAPSSLATLKNGHVIWMGEDGFYLFQGQEDYSRGVDLISNDVDLFVKRMTHGRRKQAVAAVDPTTGEYRCWVSLDGSTTNNFCFIFDGTGWRTRRDVQATAVCVTRDHRNYMLVAGQNENTDGVWLLDHEQPLYQPPAILARTAVLETAWLSSAQSQEKRTAYTLYLWLRETSNSSVKIEVMRDWRNTVIETTTAERYSGDDIPPFWGSTELGGGKTWKKRRPYWTRAAVYVPSAEVFKFRISGVGRWEFVGIQLDEANRYAGGARIPP